MLTRARLSDLGTGHCRLVGTLGWAMSRRTRTRAHDVLRKVDVKVGRQQHACLGLDHLAQWHVVDAVDVLVEAALL
eukprot:3107988-Prymnesium_polylepis.1